MKCRAGTGTGGRYSFWRGQAKAQEEFIEFYKELKETKGANDSIYFMDGAHPQHNSVAGYGWIKRGKVKELKSNTGRKRLNINGAIYIENLSPVVENSNSINAQSTISLLNRLSENTKLENLDVDIKGFMTRKSVKILILGQPVNGLPL